MINLNNTYSYNQILSSLTNLHSNGLPTGISSGIDELDNLFKIDKGKLVTVYGIPNKGKSEFVDFLCVQYQNCIIIKLCSLVRKTRSNYI